MSALDFHPQPLSVAQCHDPNTVFVAFGANLPGPYGKPETSVAHAIERMETWGDTILHGSLLYRTPAFPPGAGADYVNAVVAVKVENVTRFITDAIAIEAAFRRAEERAMGRWKPRTIDIDIVAVGQAIWPDADTHDMLRTLPQIERTKGEHGIVVPHPSMHERSFVLKPMAYFAPDWVHPILGKTVHEMAEACPEEDLAAVRPIEDAALK